MARTLNSLSYAQGALGRAEAAEASCTEALGLYRELWAARPDSESAQADVAETLNNVGAAQGDLGQAEAAEASCTEALDLYRELWAAHPDSQSAKTNVAWR